MGAQDNSCTCGCKIQPVNFRLLLQSCGTNKHQWNPGCCCRQPANTQDVEQLSIPAAWVVSLLVPATCVVDVLRTDMLSCLGCSLQPQAQLAAGASCLTRSAVPVGKNGSTNVKEPMNSLGRAYMMLICSKIFPGSWKDAKNPTCLLRISVAWCTNRSGKPSEKHLQHGQPEQWIQSNPHICH